MVEVVVSRAASIRLPGRCKNSKHVE